MRSRRSEIAHPAPVPVPKNLRLGFGFVCPSSGISQVESTLLDVATSFKCAGDGSPTSFLGIVNVLMMLCTARSFAQSRVCLEMYVLGISENVLWHYCVSGIKSGSLRDQLQGIDDAARIWGRDAVWRRKRPWLAKGV
jgi:hypothetical protein